MELFDGNDLISTCCQGDISVRIFRTVLFPPAEAQSGPSQTSLLYFFMTTVIALN